mgnify:CR=1 FL=1
MKIITEILLILFLLFAGSSAILSQDEADTSAADNNTVISPVIQPDTADTLAADLTDTADTPAGFQMEKDPLAAILWSLALPGAGQIYVESYWKAPLFIGAAGALGYLIVDNHNQFMEFSDIYENLKTRRDDLRQRIENLPEGEDPSELRSQLNIVADSADFMRQKKEVYRDNRDLSGLYLLGVYLLSAVDAYVGAHLYDFTVSDDLAIYLLPTRQSFFSVNVRIRF